VHASAWMHEHLNRRVTLSLHTHVIKTGPSCLISLLILDGCNSSSTSKACNETDASASVGNATRTSLGHERGQLSSMKRLLRPQAQQPRRPSIQPHHV
jgi:hypothetical protein